MNWIQKHIFKELTLHTNRRYSDMRPKDVEGNLFMYHLEKLITKGYIVKEGKDYTLTTRGRRYAGVISVDSGELRIQPKIVTMLVVRNKRGEYLLFRWQRQPFIGQVSFPYGKTHYGESVFTMAEREQKMKTNLDGNLHYLGDVYVKTTQGHEAFNHMLAHVFEVKSFTGEAKSSVKTGEAFWAHPEKLIASELTPGFMDIYNLVKKHGKDRFFEEIFIEK
ncbi:MAG: NUDIX domain-containing protein [bacterium]|nr:NUDIX domain-containing protein [bacterium]